MTTQCSNYGALENGICQCPSGFGGSDCTSLVCNNPIAALGSRSAAASTVGSTGCQGAGQCTDGFRGLDCNICSSNSACTAAVQTERGSGDATSGQIPGGSDIECSNSPFTYTTSFVECDVRNPTLQGVFPGTTTLKFQKNLRTNIALSEAYGGDNTTFAQLWYSSSSTAAPAEQFFCSADSCTQRNDTSLDAITWGCQNLRCNCIEGTTFCSGALPLLDTINGLSGTLDIDCANNGTTCQFKQATLNQLFGQNGLGLSGCTFGECVASTVVQQYSDSGSSAASDNSLSGGVIAGLAVVGALVLAFLVLLGLGLMAQRKAKQGAQARKHIDDVSPAGLSWSNVSYTLASGKGQAISGLLRKRNTRGIVREGESSSDLVNTQEKDGGFSSRPEDSAGRGKLIIDGISGSLPSGGLMAILGPSGAGKSTLVDILAGKRKLGHVQGSVHFITGADVNQTRVRVGYVDQADVLPANLTVREALMFAANLKLPEGVPAEEKEHRVWEILGQLGLRDIANSRIGSGERRGISGGERRRLSIGLELIAKPSILILDEPTSGLDSTSAMKVARVLQQLATGSIDAEHSRTTIIATIHQPSSQIFHAFDSVLLLSSRGSQVYFGQAKQATSFFEELGHPCPHDWNPADHLLELATSPSVVLSVAGRQSQTGQSFGNGGHDSSSEGDDKIYNGNDSNGSAYPPGLSKNGGDDDAGHSVTALKRRNSKPATTLLTQFEVLSSREYLNLKRDWSLIVMHNVVAVLVGLFVGGMYFKVDTTISGFQNRIGALFFLGALIAFSALSALSNLVTVRSLFLRERSGSYYGPVMWMLSRVVWDIIPLRILPTLLLGVITYWMVGLTPDAAHFFKFLLILVEFSAAMTLWNLLLAVIVPQPAVAILVSNVINLAQLAYAGFFVNLNKIPPVLRWIQWLNPLKYGLEALAVNEVGGGLLIDDKLQGVNVQISASLIMELLFGFKPNAYYRDVLVLFGWIGLFGICLILSIIRLREIR